MEFVLQTAPGRYYNMSPSLSGHRGLPLKKRGADMHRKTNIAEEEGILESPGF